MGATKALTHWGREGRPFWKVRVFDYPGENKEIQTFPGGERFCFRRGMDVIIPDAVLEAIKQAATPIGDLYDGEWYLPVKKVGNVDIKDEKYRDTINRFPMTTPIEATEEEFVAQMKAMHKRKRKRVEYDEDLDD
jgi:hypothetical protein